ncbi:MAG: hypothetical protein JWO71_3389 [Candidatus Acidoferrum typicum]|nr:hypothetical protein [Candidatus Acidoferrum typicum]
MGGVRACKMLGILNSGTCRVPDLFESDANKWRCAFGGGSVRGVSPRRAEKHGVIREMSRELKCRALLAACEVFHFVRKNRGDTDLVLFVK